MQSLNSSEVARAVSENYYLRMRLREMEDEDQKPGTFTQVSFVNTKAVDKLKRRNDELRSSVAELEKELMHLRSVNVTELCHEYLNLDQRRSYLNNENISLRNILLNQKRDVKRATSAINFCQEKRRQNDSQNESMHYEIEMLRMRRKSILHEIHDLYQKERRLEEELQFISISSEEIEKEIQRVTHDNMKKDQQIKKLTDELEALEKGETAWEGNEGDDEEIENLRNEYIYLKEQLKLRKK